MTEPLLRVRNARVDVGGTTLWSDLNLDVAPGEFIAILGANGAGKTTLLRTILGERALTSGSITFAEGKHRVGYVPQHYAAGDGAPIRARDLVSLAVDGNRFGVPWPSRERNRAVADILEQVGATELERVPISELSGGQQQRIRIGQALAADPCVLLCDEPFGSLDLTQQRIAADLINRRRADHDSAVLLVTHDITPILSMVDRVLYFAGGGYRIGSVAEVMTSATLTELYGTPIEVLQVGDRLVVVGAPEDPHEHGREHHHG
ncbi:MAG TPA: metal ABC transporter ATP-binding protein [Microbacteriaceae bacterium]|nr:metal ABC transporter ATP-binding protein [Microbacteriaceae bacterium]